MFQGRLLAIQIAPTRGTKVESLKEVNAEPGRGLLGDRYAEMNGKFSGGKIEPSQEVTLIEEEAIEAAVADYEMELSHTISRRNLLTRNTPLNHLVGREFQVGDVTLKGVELCEPCRYLEGLQQNDKLVEALRHRGGLRAQVISGGIMKVGDTIHCLNEK